MDRQRVAVLGRPLVHVDDFDADTLLLQEQGGEETDRTSADDEYLRIGVTKHRACSLAQCARTPVPREGRVVGAASDGATLVPGRASHVKTQRMIPATDCQAREAFASIADSMVAMALEMNSPPGTYRRASADLLPDTKPTCRLCARILTAPN